MGHYGDLYDADEKARKCEAKLKSIKTLANDSEKLLEGLCDLTRKLKEEGYHRLAWERLHDIVSDLKEAETQSREVSIAITHIETAIMWLKAVQ